MHKHLKKACLFFFFFFFRVRSFLLGCDAWKLLLALASESYGSCAEFPSFLWACFRRAFFADRIHKRVDFREAGFEPGQSFFYIVFLRITSGPISAGLESEGWPWTIQIPYEGQQVGDILRLVRRNKGRLGTSITGSRSGETCAWLLPCGPSSGECWGAFGSPYA